MSKTIQTFAPLQPCFRLICQLDPLGRNIFSIGIDPLPNVEDGLITIDFMGRMTGIANLAGIERLGPDLVTVITCTRRIAYADGSTENF